MKKSIDDSAQRFVSGCNFANLFLATAEKIMRNTQYEVDEAKRELALKEAALKESADVVDQARDLTKHMAEIGDDRQRANESSSLIKQLVTSLRSDEPPPTDLLRSLLSEFSLNDSSQDLVRQKLNEQEGSVTSGSTTASLRRFLARVHISQQAVPNHFYRRTDNNNNVQQAFGSSGDYNRPMNTAPVPTTINENQAFDDVSRLGGMSTFHHGTYGGEQTTARDPDGDASFTQKRTTSPPEVEEGKRRRSLYYLTMLSSA